ncbi:hypothetical protein VNO77_19150 [Canavalia gladiata]|uniref:Uncharacterized protein n=1 Tax=Canavalia gladiata TaxID=3824 RepID=A0AAN9QK95_CANGL
MSHHRFIRIQVQLTRFGPCDAQRPATGGVDGPGGLVCWILEVLDRIRGERRLPVNFTGDIVATEQGQRAVWGEARRHTSVVGSKPHQRDSMARIP